jgi:YgiT-type zinc finger domain-containing protein
LIKVKLTFSIEALLGKDKIHFIEKDVTRNYKGQTYVVPGIGIYECPNCGEKIFTSDTIHKIREHSPAYLKSDAEI